MIKLKNLWKIALATMAMSAMLVACDTGSDGESTEETGFTPGIYVAGLDAQWATDTNAGNAKLMTEGEGEVYTYTFKAKSAKPFPYGFKLCTENGWMEQFQAYDKANPTTNLTTIEIGEEFKVFEATKAMLEEKDENGEALIKDDATKWQIPQLKACTVGSEYIITFDKKNMTVKIEGEFVDVKSKKITLTIAGLNEENEKVKLILTDVPTFDVDGVATIDGSLFSWSGGQTEKLDATNCKVMASWTGAEANAWVKDQCPHATEHTDADGNKVPVATLPEGADAWAKLSFSADNSSGWVPYSTTGEFTYDWTKRK